MIHPYSYGQCYHRIFTNLSYESAHHLHSHTYTYTPTHTKNSVNYITAFFLYRKFRISQIIPALTQSADCAYLIGVMESTFASIILLSLRRIYRALLRFWPIQWRKGATNLSHTKADKNQSDYQMNWIRKKKEKSCNTFGNSWIVHWFERVTLLIRLFCKCDRAVSKNKVSESKRVMNVI